LNISCLNPLHRQLISSTNIIRQCIQLKGSKRDIAPLSRLTIAMPHPALINNNHRFSRSLWRPRKLSNGTSVSCYPSLLLYTDTLKLVTVPSIWLYQLVKFRKSLVPLAGSIGTHKSSCSDHSPSRVWM